MSGANSRTMNNYAERDNSHADVRAEIENAEQNTAVLAQWQSSGFVNSARSAEEQGKEHSEIGAGASSNPSERTAETVRSLVESMSAKIHDSTCFHVVKHPSTVYKGLFPNATREQVRDYIQAKKLAGRCCGSCLAWAVSE